MVWTAVWKNICRKKRMLRAAFERKGSRRHREGGMERIQTGGIWGRPPHKKILTENVCVCGGMSDGSQNHLTRTIKTIRLHAHMPGESTAANQVGFVLLLLL